VLQFICSSSRKLKKLSRKMPKKNQEQSKEVPVGVKVISIFYYICAVASAIYSLVNIFLLIWVKVKYITLSNTSALGGMSFYFKEVAIYILFSLLAAVIFFILARGLWRLKPWARISSINLSIAIIIYLVYQLIRASEIIYILIIWGFAMIITHLTLNEKAKEAFKK
jgi:flagellar biosynthesis protein FlhB